jgi:hypothetical protein
VAHMLSWPCFGHGLKVPWIAAHTCFFVFSFTGATHVHTHMHCLQVGADAVAGVRPGMPCTTCLHPTCRHSPARQGVMPCPECGVGVLVLDPTSGPKWRLDCSRCSCLNYLPQALHEAKVTKDACEVRRGTGAGRGLFPVCSCSCLIYLPQALHEAKVSKDVCEVREGEGKREVAHSSW